MNITYNEAIERLAEMKERYKAGFSSADRLFLEDLNVLLFQKNITVTGCADCYRDAYILIFAKLKQDKKMPDKTNYRLKPGIVGHFCGEAEYDSHNIPDEVAERYIRENPQNINDFIEYPAQKTKRGRPKKVNNEL